MVRAVIFDMDGLLLDSEIYWERARRVYCLTQGCDWTPQDELTVKGNNSPEWAARVREHCSLSTEPVDIIREVTARMRALYEERLPLLPGAVEAVRAVGARYPTGIASSSPPELIEFAMARAGLRDCFQVIVSADTVGRGKPNPDVFLITAERLGVPPTDIAVFEDSTAGITAAKRAGMYVIAVPNPHYPPEEEALAQADMALASLVDFHVEMLE